MLPLGGFEIVIVLLIVLLIFGAGTLPQVGKGIGQAIHDFKKSVSPDEEKK